MGWYSEGVFAKENGGEGSRANYHPIDDTNRDIIAMLELVTRLGDSADTKHQAPLFSKKVRGLYTMHLFEIGCPSPWVCAKA